MNEQTLSFVLKLRVLSASSDAENAPLLRGSLVQVGDAQMRHFDELERLIEILRERVTKAAVAPREPHGNFAPREE